MKRYFTLLVILMAVMLIQVKPLYQGSSNVQVDYETQVIGDKLFSELLSRF